MPLPTPRLPMASTSSLEFLGFTVSGEETGAFDPGWPFLGAWVFFSASACGAEGSWVAGEAVVSEPVDWPDGSWVAPPWAKAMPQAKRAASATVSSREELCMVSLQDQSIHPAKAEGAKSLTNKMVGRRGRFLAAARDVRVRHCTHLTIEDGLRARIGTWQPG